MREAVERALEQMLYDYLSDEKAKCDSVLLKIGDDMETGKRSKRKIPANMQVVATRRYKLDRLLMALQADE